MSEVKNKLNEIMETLVKDDEFVSHAARDRRAYYNLAQLDKELEKLETDFNEGKISNEDFEAGLNVCQEKLFQLIEEDKKAEYPD